MRANKAGWTMTAVIVAAALASVPVRAADAAAPVPGGATAATPAPIRRIVVSLPDRKLAVLENEQILALFDVAVGAPSTPSPIGTFTIVNRIPHPTYYRPGKARGPRGARLRRGVEVIPPGAHNPLGTRWLGMSQRLFEHVRAGDVVELHGERTEEIAELFE